MGLDIKITITRYIHDKFFNGRNNLPVHDNDLCKQALFKSKEAEFNHLKQVNFGCGNKKTFNIVSRKINKLLTFHRNVQQRYEILNSA